MLQTFTFPNRTSHIWSCGGGVKVGGALPEAHLASYGRVVCEPAFDFEGVYRPFAFHLIERGRGVFQLDGQPYETEPGQLVLIHPGVHARYFNRRETPWRYRWFVLGGSRIGAILHEIGLREETPVLASDWRPLLGPTLESIEQEARRGGIGPVQAVALGWAILSVLAGELYDGARSPSDTLASRAKFLMQQEYSRGLQVEELARRLRVSRATLFRQCVRAYGVPPKQMLDDIRLSQARELLLRGYSSVKEVARACGFRSARYFSRVYHRRFGEAPSTTRGQSAG